MWNDLCSVWREATLSMMGFLWRGGMIRANVMLANVKCDTAHKNLHVCLCFLGVVCVCVCADMIWHGCFWFFHLIWKYYADPCRDAPAHTQFTCHSQPHTHDGYIVCHMFISRTCSNHNVCIFFLMAVRWISATFLSAPESIYIHLVGLMCLP